MTKDLIHDAGKEAIELIRRRFQVAVVVVDVVRREIVQWIE